MTLTKDEWEAIMATRTRPVTDPHMTNSKASRMRAEQSTAYVSPIPESKPRRIIPVEELHELRVDYPIRGVKPPCGTERCWMWHYRRNQQCDECKAAKNADQVARKFRDRGNR